MILFRIKNSDFKKVSAVDWKARVPGAFQRGSTVFSPSNCAFLVRNELMKMEVKAEEINEEPKIYFDEWPKDIRSVIDEGTPSEKETTQWFMKHQHEGFDFAARRVGAMLVHPAGSGKTSTAIRWAAIDDSPILWVTRAISKIQHSKEMKRLLDIDDSRIQILDGEGPDQLYVKCYARNRRLYKGSVQILGGDKKEFISRSVSLNDLGVYRTRAVDTSARLPQGDYEISVGAEKTQFTLLDGWHTSVVFKRLDGTEGKPFATVARWPVINPNARFVIINWEILVPWLPFLLHQKFSSVVFDESHKAKQSCRAIPVHDPKNPDRLTFIPKKNISWAASEIAKTAKRRLLLSATPVKNRVQDLWAQLDLIEPWSFGSRSNWMARYAGRHIGTYGQIDDSGATNLDELRARFKLVSHHVSIKETHKYLPPLRRETIVVPASEQSDVSERSLARELTGVGPIEARIFAAAARKRKAALELIEEAIDNKQHVTLFTGRRADAEDIAETVKRKFLKGHRLGSTPIAMIHGGIDMKRRENMRAAYMNAKGSSIMIATGDSMGEAIDLNKTDVAIFSMLPYTWTQLEQWENRFWRLGQDRPVLMKYLIAAGTIDERIVALLLSKLPPVEKIAGGDTIGGIKKSILGGKSDAEIQKDLMNMILRKDEEEEDTMELTLQ